MGKSIQDAHKRLSGRVMGRPGVVGTAIGVASGKPCIKVYVARGKDGGKTRIPSRSDGFRVVVEKTGSIGRLSG